MNRVHEQCPKINSGTVLSQTGSKQAECTECTACWPSSTPRLLALPRLSAARPPSLRVSPARPSSPLAPSPAPARPPARLPSVHLPCAPCRVVGLAGHCIAIQFILALLSCHNTVRLYCNTNNPLLCNTTPPNLQYKPVYCNTKFSSPAFFCNTLEPIAIQFYPAYCTLYCNTMQPLEYKFFFHNQKRFLHSIFFFFRFSSFIRSSHWKIQKIYIYTYFFFIFQNTQINL